MNDICIPFTFCTSYICVDVNDKNMTTISNAVLLFWKQDCTINFHQLQTTMEYVKGLGKDLLACILLLVVVVVSIAIGGGSDVIFSIPFGIKLLLSK